MLITEESELLAMEMTGADSIVCFFFSHCPSNCYCSVILTLSRFMRFCVAFHLAMSSCPIPSIFLHSFVSFSFIIDSIARGLMSLRKDCSSL